MENLGGECVLSGEGMCGLGWGKKCAKGRGGRREWCKELFEKNGVYEREKEGGIARNCLKENGVKEGERERGCVRRCSEAGGG